ncbi:hypothetical protein CGRA01v4_07210 [Colletotrichum graminicola]|nr:hypothetical protein CGRA01v4_07210 [Colletotrichum graminicola]
MRDSIILIITSFFVATYCAALQPQLLHARAPTKLAIVAGQAGAASPYFCDATKEAAVQNAIKWMHTYAGSASTFLGHSNAGQTAAFVAWFGWTNRALASDVKLHVIDPILALGATATMDVSSLEARNDIISIGCGTPQGSQICKGDPNTVAYADPKDNTVVLCPAAFARSGFFGKDSTEQTAISDWATQRYMRPSGAFYLLHEMTHLPSLVGGFKGWTAAPVKASHDYAYRVNQCANLMDKQKLNNAQNYAFFGLEVLANGNLASHIIGNDARDKDDEAFQWLRGKGGKRSLGSDFSQGDILGHSEPEE